MKIIVGLGNPGKEYEKTAHNAGFMVVDRLAGYGLRVTGFKFEKKIKSEIAEGEIGKEKVLIVRPQMFMNRSGEAAAAVLNFYKADLADLIVVHDDADLPLGKIKVKNGGGSAGHHGIESIIKAWGEGFIRVRIGIRTGEEKAETFVLTSFKEKEQQLFEEMIKKAAHAVVEILENGLTATVNKFN